jgi:hypothetical protein
VFGDDLVRTDGSWWPAEVRCVPRIYVEWRGGLPVPPLASMAAAEVADELVKACDGDASCRLPSNVITLTRQGITLNFIDPAVLLDAGLWGLPRVDAAIRTFNPSHLAQRSVALSPDRPRFRPA